MAIDTLDDRIHDYNPFKSDCRNCAWFNGEEALNCAAFPTSIPVSILRADKKHREPWKSQKNKIVFKSK